MPDLERLEIIGTADDSDSRPFRPALWFRTRPWFTWFVAGALVVALGAVAVLGSLLYADRHRSDADRAAIATAEAWVDAMNARDIQALHRIMTAEGAVSFLNATGLEEGYTDEPLWQGAQGLFEDGIHLTVVSEPIVAQGGQVSMVIHMHRGQDDAVDLHIFDLTRQNGRLLVEKATVMSTAPLPKA